MTHELKNIQYCLHQKKPNNEAKGSSVHDNGIEKSEMFSLALRHCQACYCRWSSLVRLWQEVDPSAVNENCSTCSCTWPEIDGAVITMTCWFNSKDAQLRGPKSSQAVIH